MISDEKLKELLKLMEEREERLAERKALTPRWRFPDWWEATVGHFNRQTSCRHLKGGMRGRAGLQDHAVVTHEFSNRTVRIKCVLCGWEVWNDRRWSYKWAIGLRMAKNSSNVPSSSQIVAKTVAPYEAIPFKRPMVTLEMTEKGNYMKADWGKDG
jgi:hypothetical protein